jgi:hypothetical protein
MNDSMGINFGITSALVVLGLIYIVTALGNRLVLRASPDVKRVILTYLIWCLMLFYGYFGGLAFSMTVSLFSQTTLDLLLFIPL